MKPVMLTLLLSLILLAGLPAQETEALKTEAPAPKIQIALLLDTSGSMSGLINQAKAQLWKIVNEFVNVRKDGKRPELEVALFEYGNDGLPAKENWIRMILPLTDDLDKVSEELFALTTNGGSEYCGAVIQKAVDTLVWSESTDDLKAIFIAGNEPFTQGGIDYRKACPAAIQKSIMVNTIFCGPYQTGVSTHWKDGASLADGSYMNIDHNAKAVHIEAPQDEEIAKLGVELNKTYISYGRKGREGAKRQAMQDSNASSLRGGSAAQRAVSKSSAYYRNSSWDLVDAEKEGKADISKLKKEELPENMQKMTVEERKAYIEKMAEQRAEIQEKIRKLNEERKKYVAAEQKKLAEKGENTLDGAMIKALRSQAAEKSFKAEE